MMTTIRFALSMTFGQRAAYAGRMLLIGMCVVFFALLLLWGVLVLFRLCTVAISKRAQVSEVTAKGPDAAAEIPTQTESGTSSDDPAVVAAITAAVAMALAEENGGQAPAFRVVSFRRIRTTK